MAVDAWERQCQRFSDGCETVNLQVSASIIQTIASYAFAVGIVVVPVESMGVEV